MALRVLLCLGLHALALVNADFTERYRPQYHFSPEENWMNDPNGLIYHKGEYHLFFQYNPYSALPGNISWGHAVSSDLVHWEQLPVAIWSNEMELIFSGCVVSDQDNTSGLGTQDNPPLVAFYTSARSDRQAQSIAYSLDDGRTWTKFAGNPVVDHGLPEFRDPKVFWHEPTKKWILLLVVSDRYMLQIYSSKDLKNWTLLSLFGPKNAKGGVWECPDMFPLSVDGDPARMKWVLIISINPGAPYGGSATQYFVGNFNGTHFEADENSSYVPDWATSSVEPAAWLDYGKDYYAAVSWLNAPAGRRIMIGWMSNWEYGRDTPTSPWRNAMSVPREVTLRTIGGQVRLVQTPVVEMALLRGSPASPSVPKTLTDAAQQLAQKGTAYELNATLANMDAEWFGVAVRGGIGEETAIGYNVSRRELCVDRRASGKVDFNAAHFPGVHCAPLPLDGGKLKLRVLVDWNCVEVYGGDGLVVITDLIYPDEDSDSISVFAAGGRVRIDALTVSQYKTFRKSK